MRTPAGAECAYYYEDQHRGRDLRECRADREPGSPTWTERDCGRCPVPAILHANGSPDLRILLKVRKGILGLGGRVEARTRCSRHDITVDDPFTGCPQCTADTMAGFDLEDPDV